jgi:peptide-methionine (R)-S-oxide reductase
MTYDVTKTDEQWRAELTAEEYAVLRKAGTERPWTGEYNETKTEGVYSCRACGTSCSPATRSSTRTAAGRASTPPRTATPSSCARGQPRHAPHRGAVRECGSHLGHLFDDAPQTPTGDRYCMNSLSLRLRPKEQSAP